LTQTDATFRKIIHFDCDCFYAAIEERDDPSLRGHPLAVGGSAEGRGVVATCNYEARKFGIHSAMPTREALRRCRDLRVLRPAMDKYRRASKEILAIYRSVTELVEPLSLDEAFLDVSATKLFGGSATLTARDIKARVREQVGITVSAGVAPNKFLAKIASDWEKPDGFTVVLPAEVDAFVAALPIERIFGVGAVTAAKLKAAGFHTCEEIRARSRQDLKQMFGALGDRLYELSRGIDHRRVDPDSQRKSLSVETTYTVDLKSLVRCTEELDLLITDLASQATRLKSGDRIEAVFVKIRFDDFRKTTVERRATAIHREQLQEMLTTGVARHARAVRLLGVGVRVVHDDYLLQMALFDGPAAARQSENGSPT
jgi:DNA polymerase-4